MTAPGMSRKERAGAVAEKNGRSNNNERETAAAAGKKHGNRGKQHGCSSPKKSGRAASAPPKSERGRSKDKKSNDKGKSDKYCIQHQVDGKCTKKDCKYVHKMAPPEEKKKLLAMHERNKSRSKSRGSSSKGGRGKSRDRSKSPSGKGKKRARIKVDYCFKYA